MRILEISPYNFVHGGSDRYFLTVSQLLEQAGHEVHRFCKRDDRNLPSKDAAFFVPGIDPAQGGISDALRMLYSRAAARNLEALLDAHPIDLAHLHIYYGHFSGSILNVLKKRGIPSVQTIHDYKVACPISTFNRHGEICEDCQTARFWKTLQHRCNRGSLPRSALSMTEAYLTNALGAKTAMDRYIAVCRFQADRLIAHDLPAERVRVLYNFVDPEDFPQVTRRQPPDSIVYFGRIERSKGIETLLKAFLAVPEKEREGVKLRFAGGGSFVGALKALIAEAGDPSVEFVGFLNGEETGAFFETALCSVLTPFVYENCSMSVLESLSRGVAVIGSDMGGLPEIIRDRVDGWIVPPEDQNALSGVIRSILNDPQKAIAMGLKGREKITREFDPASHCDALIGHFNEVLAARNPSEDIRGQ